MDGDGAASSPDVVRDSPPLGFMDLYCDDSQTRSYYAYLRSVSHVVSPRHVLDAVDRRSEVFSVIDMRETCGLVNAIDYTEFCIRFESTEYRSEETINTFLSDIINQTHLSKAADIDANILLLVHNCPVPLRTANLKVESITSNSVESITNNFRNNGMCILSDIFRNCKEDLRTISDRVYNYISILRQKMLQLDESVPIRFKEIMKRDEGRYDCNLCDDIFVGTDFCLMDIKLFPLYSLISSILQSDDVLLLKRGVVFSTPGTGSQYFHADCTPQTDAYSALCVFLPLINLTEVTGYTSFWIGSHLHNQSDLLQHNLPELLAGTRNRIDNTNNIFKGTADVGEAILYDYKLIHRGEANNSKDIRPVIYFIFCKRGFNEDYNFTNMSIDSKL
jgi:ectoine hydroxylase-related dioxygenase (phytanoyl-CoA dioxygenase family)